MIWFFLQVATPEPQQIAACAAAVHGNLPSAVTVCATGRVDLFNGKAALRPSCVGALQSGVQAGKFGPKLPPFARDGYIRDFDRKLAACRAPAEPAPKIIETVELGD